MQAQREEGDTRSSRKREALHPLKARTGEWTRIFFGVGGLNIGSNFHINIIGEIFDRVYAGSPDTFVANEETVYMPPGSTAIFEFTTEVPGHLVRAQGGEEEGRRSWEGERFRGGPMIRGEWSIEELRARYPRSREVLIRWGMWCPVCALAGLETLADAARVYGVEIEAEALASS